MGSVGPGWLDLSIRSDIKSRVVLNPCSDVRYYGVSMDSLWLKIFLVLGNACGFTLLTG